MTGVVNITIQEEALTSPEVERAILGHILRAPENWVVGCLALEDFTVESSRKLLEIMAAMIANEERISVTGLACEVARRTGDGVFHCSGIKAILEIDDAAAAQPDLGAAIETLRSLSLRRQLFDLARWLWMESQRRTNNPGHLLSELHVQIAAVDSRWLP